MSHPYSERHLAGVAHVLGAAFQRPLARFEANQVAAFLGEGSRGRQGQPVGAATPDRTHRAAGQCRGVGAGVGSAADAGERAAGQQVDRKRDPVVRGQREPVEVSVGVGDHELDVGLAVGFAPHRVARPDLDAVDHHPQDRGVGFGRAQVHAEAAVVADVVTDAAEVAAKVTPVIAVAKTVANATKKKAK